MNLEVKTEAVKTRYRLQIYVDGKHIGEHETSNEAEIARKKQEIEAAIGILLETFNKHGKFKVDWDNKNRKKSIRINGVEVGEVPRSAWKKPSWE